MSEVRFQLISNKYVYVSYYASDGRVRMSIGKTVEKELWDKNKLPKPVSQRINRITLLVDEYIIKEQSLNNLIYKADIEKLIEGVLDDKVRSKASKKTVKTAFDEYLELMKSGEILNDGKPFKSSTMVHYRAISSEYLIEGIGDRGLNDFGVAQFEDFKRAILAKGRSQNTMSVYVTQLKTFFKRTHRMGWHKNDVFLKEDVSVAPEKIESHVYLTTAEIERIENYQLHNIHRIRARDSFVFGCYTGLRHSDLRKLSPDSYNDGCLHLSTQKTGSEVVIPLNAKARAIWEKYNGKIPVPNHGNFYNSVQELAKNVGFTEPTLYTLTKGGVKESKYYPKWELISPHTMRRSFATNAYIAGVPTIAIMKITGHKTESAFMKYIRISNKESAENVKSHAFFQ